MALQRRGAIHRRVTPRRGFGGGAGRSPEAFTPATLGGLQFWVAIDSPGHLWQDSARTIPAAVDGDPVGCWDDLSYLDNHALQTAAASKRPTLRLGILNERAALRFDGVDDYLKTPNFATSVAQPMTMVFVARQVTLQAATVRFLTWGPPTGAGATGMTTGTQTYSLQSPSPAVQSVPTADTSPHVFTVGLAPTSQLWRDGTSLISAVVGANGVGGLTLASNSTLALFTTIDFSEVIVYNRALSLTDRQTIERYLGSKYAITVA